MTVVRCEDIGDLFALLDEGIRNRKLSSHDLNKDSSRSHFILSLYVIQEVVSVKGVSRNFGKISFVDLAGSERIKDSKTMGDLSRPSFEGNPTNQQVSVHLRQGNIASGRQKTKPKLHPIQRLKTHNAVDGFSWVS